LREKSTRKKIAEGAQIYFSQAGESPFVYGADLWEKIERAPQFDRVCKALLPMVDQFEAPPKGVTLKSKNKEEEKYNAFFLWLMMSIEDAFRLSIQAGKHEQNQRALEKLIKAKEGINACVDGARFLASPSGYPLKQIEFKEFSINLSEVEEDIKEKLKALDGYLSRQIRLTKQTISITKLTTTAALSPTANEIVFVRVLCEKFENTFTKWSYTLVARITNALLDTNLIGKDVSRMYRKWKKEISFR